jgi:hypothetical protein
VKPITELIEFLTQKMSLAAIYQPAIILHLLSRGGTASRAELALTLSGYDGSDLKEWDRILMKNPKQVLVNTHQILTYDKDSQLFHLNVELNDPEAIALAKTICEQKLTEWIQKQIDKGETSDTEILRFYRILEAAKHSQSNDLIESTFEIEDFAMRMAVSEAHRLFPQQEITQQPYSTLGFDILVGTATDPIAYIKVKGTQAIAPNFIITEAERAFSVEKASRYLLLVIYAINLTSEEYKVAVHRGALTAQTVALSPIQWKCSLKEF